jgi:hypothetical protein
VVFALALNGSPRGLAGNTQALLTPLLEGMSAAGAATELVLARDLRVGFCTGCYTCWGKTPGICAQDDDMTALLGQFRRADYVVYATPLYHFGMTAMLKRVLERTLPLLDPRIIRRGDRSGHPLRPDAKRSKWVLLSNCGFPDRIHFEPLVQQFQHLTADGRALAATILVAGGEALGRTYTPGGPMEWLNAALRQAGREIVAQGHLSPETETVLTRPLVPPADYVTRANESWGTK